MLSNQRDQVLVLASEFEAKALPPVCAMSGAPAEVWQRFRFATIPDWAGALNLLHFTGVGTIPALVVTEMVSRRARGYLPLTRASRRWLRLVWLISVGFMLSGIVLVLGAVGIHLLLEHAGVGGSITLFWVAIALFFVGALAWLLVKPRVGPSGDVLKQSPGQIDAVIRLRRVHPRFVEAVEKMRLEREARIGTLDTATFVAK